MKVLRCVVLLLWTVAMCAAMPMAMWADESAPELAGAKPDEKPPAEPTSDAESLAADVLRRLEISGYATVNTFFYAWDSIPDLKNQTDLERVALKAEYEFAEWLKLEIEIEFEHGGVGAAFEFERFEEFGEFEQEVEKGGEIVIEELVFEFILDPALKIKVGHVVVPVGFTNNGHGKPFDYFGVSRPFAETGVIPTIWHENGVLLTGRIDSLRYVAGVVRSLDSSRFGSANWVAAGNARLFELDNSDDWAATALLEWSPIDELSLSVSGFIGNTAGNRPSADLTVDAVLYLINAHAEFNAKFFIARGSILYGYLQNSAFITNANRQLPNALEAQRTPVGKAGMGAFLEMGLDVLGLLMGDCAGDWALFVFARVETVDAMAETAGNIQNNPRFESQGFAAGINVFARPWVVFKLEFTYRELGLSADFAERTVGLGIGLQF